MCNHLTGLHPAQPLTHVSGSTGKGMLVAYLRRKRDDDSSRYLPETPVWVRGLGGKSERVVTVDMRDGRRISGYLEAYEVDADGAPGIFLSPPIRVDWIDPGRRWRPAEPKHDQFRGNGLTIAGSELTAVWSPYGEE